MSPRTRRWITAASGSVAAVLIAVLAYSVCTALNDPSTTAGRWPRVADDDPSIVLDEPFHTNHGQVNENGTAYDRAVIDLAGATAVVLPDYPPPDRGGRPQDSLGVEVRPGGPPDRLELLLTKHLAIFGHFEKGASIRESRRQIAVRVARSGSVVAVDIDPGSSHFEGGLMVDVVVTVPNSVSVRREVGLRRQFRDWHEVLQEPVPQR